MIDPKPQAWIVFRRPRELPADALPGDWPGAYVARRFERNEKAEMVPTEDVIGGLTSHALRHAITMRYPRKDTVMTRQPRAPEDHDTIIETIFARPRMVSPDKVAIQDRLPSGMRVDEAVERAERWWDTQGRHTIRKEFNQEIAAPKIHVGTGTGYMLGNGVGPTTVIPGEVRDTIPSGILKALPWAMLTRREQVAVVLKWHDAKVEQ